MSDLVNGLPAQPTARTRAGQMDLPSDLATVIQLYPDTPKALVDPNAASAWRTVPGPAGGLRTFFHQRDLDKLVAQLKGGQPAAAGTPQPPPNLYLPPKPTPWTIEGHPATDPTPLPTPYLPARPTPWTMAGHPATPPPPPPAPPPAPDPNQPAVSPAVNTSDAPTNMTPEQAYQYYGAKYHINPVLLRAIGQVESGGRTFDANGNLITSSAGAQGLAQFMPATAQRYGVNVRDPVSSIGGMAHYMRDLLNHYGGNVDMALQAYNGAIHDSSFGYTRKIRDAMLAAHVPQQLISPSPRGPGEWGRPPEMDPNVPGSMPTPRDVPNIMRAAPALIAISALASRLPLGLSLYAYGMLMKARANGQVQEAQKQAQIWKDQLAIHNAQQSLEGQQVGDAFIEFDQTKDPDDLQRALIGIGGRFNDPQLIEMAQRRDFTGIDKINQRRDMLNQNNLKLQSALEKEQSEQQKIQDARQKRESIAKTTNDLNANDPVLNDPNATPEQKALARDRNAGRAQAIVAGHKDPEAAGTAKAQSPTEQLAGVGNTAAEAQYQQWLQTPEGQKADPTQRAMQRAKLYDQQAWQRAAGARPKEDTYWITKPDGNMALVHGTLTPDGVQAADGTMHAMAHGTTAIPASRQSQPDLPPSKWTGNENWPGKAQGAPPPGDPFITPDIWGLAKMWAETGRQPTGLYRNSGMQRQTARAWPIAMNALGIRDPATQAIKYAAMSDAVKSTIHDFTATGAARSNQMVSLNTIAGHINLMREYIAALKNDPAGAPTILNQISNAFHTSLGYPQTTDFNVMREYLGDEMTRLITTTGGSAGDRANAHDLATKRMSNDQLLGYTNVIQNIVHERLTALHQHFTHFPGSEIMRDDLERWWGDMLTPDSSRMFTGPEVPVAGLPGATEQPSTATPGTLPGGWH